MAENFANNYSTALDGAIDNSQTTFDVLSVGGAPSVNFRIKVENELMLVTGVSSLTFTVTRGIEGTSAASHADGTLVTHVVTAAVMNEVAHGDWTNYTPTVTATTTNPTIASRQGRYKRLDSTTYAIRIQINFATGDNAGSGAWSVSLPSGFTTAGGVDMHLAGHIHDAGTRRYVCNGYITSGNSVVSVIVHSESGQNGTIGNTSPMTWANGDQFFLSGIVEGSF